MQRASEEAPSSDGTMAHGSLQRLTAAQSEGRLDEASSHLARSIELSRQTKNHQEEEKCSVLLGVVQGLMGFDEHKQEVQAHVRHGRRRTSPVICRNRSARRAA